MWLGDFYIGEYFSVYVGSADANDIHEHAAYQLIYSHSGNVAVEDEHATKTLADTVLISPLAPHRIRSDSQLTMVYLEPQSELVSKLLENIPSGQIAILDRSLLPIEQWSEPEALIFELSQLSSKLSQSIDKRVLLAMEILMENRGKSSISEIAVECGLSESRLRTLAREQLGIPLANWHTWCKLRLTVKRLRAGDKLIDAALAGGFSDQAHFTRTMRKMFGVTPSIAMGVLA